MWRLLIGAGLLSLAALPAASQSLPSKKEATLLLQKAADATDLRAPDTPPFHLVARVHHESAGYRADGTYELLWAIHRFFFEGNKAKVHRVYSATAAGKMLTCVDVPSRSEGQKSKTCFDSSTLKVVSLSFKTELEPSVFLLPSATRAVADFEEQAEFSDFTDFGEKRYPRNIELRQFGDDVQVRVDVLDRVAEFDPNVFVPARESIARDWCSRPVTKGNWPYPWAPTLAMTAPLRLIAYYVLVGPDGRVEKSAPLHPAVKNVDSQVESWLADTRYPVDLCNGKPMEYEMVIQPLSVSILACRPSKGLAR